MKKLGDIIIKYCKKCKNNQTFEVSQISEYGEIFGICEKCKDIMKL